MHPRNPHVNGYDMATLTQALPELAPFIVMSKQGRESINFSDSNAVKLLNKALLIHEYGLHDWDIPQGYLCPPIPGRADYLCHLYDYLMSLGLLNTDHTIRGLDIGTGANLIYPLLANRLFGWHMLGADIDSISLQSAQNILNGNADLQLPIELRLQSNPENMFQGVIQIQETFLFSMCNPPFHSSKQAAMAGSERKNKNLNRNKQKRLSNQRAIKDTKALNFSGQSNELWCEGGERRFITKMIFESQTFKQQVACFTCLVSKKETLQDLKRPLKKVNAIFDVVKMQQGNKESRFIAWRYE
ncbi:MAG: 23S rRNA (adenine(1618)-N(6))-methyltransferase RlmF [Gammaproteobacteria bacterium]|nr:23S rRNA (adenine(1618)-N(6))-methyltransferase RlmF [Gammaproteobacteria bacterium]